jgi:hypothetical protein
MHSRSQLRRRDKNTWNQLLAVYDTVIWPYKRFVLADYEAGCIRSVTRSDDCDITNESHRAKQKEHAYNAAAKSARMWESRYLMASYMQSTYVLSIAYLCTREHACLLSKHALRVSMHALLVSMHA